MTLRTAAGRRTLNVRGQLTTNVRRKRLPQITPDCAEKNTVDGGNLEIMSIRKWNSVNLSVQLLKIKAVIFRIWCLFRVRSLILLQLVVQRQDQVM